MPRLEALWHVSLRPRRCNAERTHPSARHLRPCSRLRSASVAVKCGLWVSMSVLEIVQTSVWLVVMSYDECDNLPPGDCSVQSTPRSESR
jgi:hypothetical protein